MSTTNLDQISSYEWRGPFLSLCRVSQNSLDVLRPETDWSDVVGDKPLVDNRNANLGDLFPRPRVMLERIMNQMEEQQGSAERPKMRSLGR
mgnify:CR=1 FL=1